MRRLSLPLLLVVLFCISGNNCFAAEVTLEWDANSEPDLAGYRLYYGTVSGIYPYQVDVGNVTQWTLTQLAEDIRYYMAVTAYDTDGNESGYSNEVNWISQSQLPPPPEPPTNGNIYYEEILPGQVLYFEDFESYASGSDPTGWIDTEAGNSMAENQSLFKVIDGALTVQNAGINIHSHYAQEFALPFIFSGRIKAFDPSIGITFCSDYPNSDTYYRLRTYNGGSFNISPHPYTGDLGGECDSYFTPVIGEWHNFKVNVSESNNEVLIKAKVWLEGTPEPDWQINCYGSNLISGGKIGIWSMDSTNNQWDDLKVENGN